MGYGERIAKTYLFRVERGKTYPTPPRLRILARIYRVRLSRLVESLESAVDEQELSADLGLDLKEATFDELRKLGIEAERGGDFSKATLLYRAAWERAESASPSPTRQVLITTARHDLSIALRNAGRLELAREEVEAALELAPRPSKLLDRVRLTLSTVYRRLGNHALAREILEGLLARSGELTQRTLGGAHEAMGNLEVASQPKKAASHYRTALAVANRLQDTFEKCKLLHNLGIAEAKAGNFDRGLKRLHEGREVAKQRQFNYMLAAIHNEIAKTLYLKGEKAKARLALKQADDLARKGEYYSLLFIDQYYLRRLAIEEGNEAEARIAEASLRFFATRLEEPCDELRLYQEEQK